MPTPPADRLGPDPVLADIAEYALSFKIASAPAYETACYCLMDALACGFQALQHPACSRLLGPVVPGATLTGGARVPGTSYELDPINAAFNIGAMMRWLDLNDTGLATEWGHPADNLGGILAVADYLSRSGRSVTVRDVLTALIKAHEIQGVLALAGNVDRVGLDDVVWVRVASAAVVTAMLGGTCDQIVNAASNAWIDGAPRIPPHAPNMDSRKRWAAADATSRAVRHGLFALQDERGVPAARLVGGALAVPPAFGHYEGVPVLVKKFEASVAAHFGARQTESIKKMFVDHATLAQMPVSALMARLVSAG